MLIIGLVALAAMASAAFWYYDLGHDPVEKIPELHGLSMDEVLARYGDPDVSDDFTLADPLPEFRIELYNTYPPDDPANRSIEIRERQWHYSRHNLAVWFHFVHGKWMALDTCRWKHGIEC